ncbi:MAG: DUF4141 domain-containing protein [Verrucomicrobiota bacterium]
MKRLIALAFVTIAFAIPVRAQWIVYDPVNNLQQILNTAQEIAKFIEVINNQVQQIETLTDQLDEFRDYKEKFGDPRAIALAMVPALNADLMRTELGDDLDDLLTIADGTFALNYDGGGIFQIVGETFTTPRGQVITRPADEYKPFAAVSRTADNYMTVAEDVAARRVAIKNQIAQTTAQLRSATTDAEVQKLQGVLSSLNADLASTDSEVNQAIGSALVQDIQNRNDQQKQQRALLERQNAEFEEAITNYTAKFRLLNAPSVFPTP